MVQEGKGAPGAGDDAISGSTSRDVKFLYLKINKDRATKPLKASKVVFHVALSIEFTVK